MAIKECKECSQQVSTKATSCPHCGATLKRETGYLTWVVAIIFIFFMTGLFSSLYDTSSTSTEETSPSESSTLNATEANNVSSTSSSVGLYTFNGYTINTKEKKILKAILISSFYSFLQGKETVVSPQTFNFYAINVT